MTVDEFKGTTLVALREYYTKDGKELPGKSGISLNIEQYLNFLKAIPLLNTELEKKGFVLPAVIVESTLADDEDKDQSDSDEK